MHLDGFNQLPYLTGQQANPRARFIYLTMTASRRLRFGNWKVVFEEQRAGTLVWGEPFTKLALRIVRSARRSLRAGGHHLQHLLGLVDTFSLLLWQAASCAVYRDLQGISAQPEAAELLRGPDYGEVAAAGERLIAEAYTAASVKMRRTSDHHGRWKRASHTALPRRTGDDFMQRCQTGALILPVRIEPRARAQPRQLRPQAPGRPIRAVCRHATARPALAGAPRRAASTASSHRAGSSASAAVNAASS